MKAIKNHQVNGLAGYLAAAVFFLIYLVSFSSSAELFPDLNGPTHRKLEIVKGIFWGTILALSLGLTIAITF